jgi:hypothetical protein
VVCYVIAMIGQFFLFQAIINSLALSLSLSLSLSLTVVAQNKQPLDSPATVQKIPVQATEL